MAERVTEQASLANKDWGISINQSGELEVTGSLSDNEGTLIPENQMTTEIFLPQLRNLNRVF
jgi:hypothetical protein